MLEAGMVDHIIASHVGMNPLIGDGMIAGTLKCTLVPQGTLAEKIRAANYCLLYTSTSSTSRAGSTTMTSSGDGCIFALMNGRQIKMTAHMIRL